MMDTKRSAMWVIYEKPADFPDGFIARKHVIDVGSHRPTMTCAHGETLESVRSQLPPGLVRLDRSPGDDPVIVESWM